MQVEENLSASYRTHARTRSLTHTQNNNLPGSSDCWKALKHMSQVTWVSSPLTSTETIPELIPGTKHGLSPHNTHWKLYCEQIAGHEFFSDVCSISKEEDYPLSSNPDRLFQHSCSNTITVFRHMTPCGHTKNMLHLLRDTRSSLLTWIWMQQVPPKRWYESIRLHGDMSRKGENVTYTAIRNTNIMHVGCDLINGGCCNVRSPQNI